MKLLIHDLNNEEWNKISSKYNGWEVISDNGSIHPCVGCFGCWIKTPGKCVIRDGYERMGTLFHKAEEVIIISKYAYGGFSPFIKNVFDRSIGWVLPYFEIIKGEMHHKSRYPEDKLISFIFRGSHMTNEDKALAKSYVEAVCTNLHGKIKSITFEESLDEKADIKDSQNAVLEEKAILLNCSLRADKSNTKRILNALSRNIYIEKELINISNYMNRIDELLSILKEADRIILGIPLYVDGIPSHVLRIMEKIEKMNNMGNKKIYVVTNMGFYESAQEENLIHMTRKWTECCGFTYGGGLGIGAGEMVGKMIDSSIAEKGPSRNAALALNNLGVAISESRCIEDMYINPYMFPRALYIMAANSSWPRDAKENGLKKRDLLIQPD